MVKAFPLRFSTVRQKPRNDPTTAPAQVVLAAVLQVRARRLHALLWQRAREPYSGAWALPGGTLAADETLDGSIRRQLAAKVDVREVAHLEQLGTLERARAAPEPPGARDRVPRPGARRRRPGAAGRHRLARRRRAPAARVRPCRDHPRGPRAAARQALVHERRLRARAGRVHALRAARPLRGGARPRRLGDEPEASAAPPQRARADRSAARAGAHGRTAGRGLSLPQPPARDHGSVRGAPASA